MSSEVACDSVGSPSNMGAFTVVLTAAVLIGSLVSFVGCSSSSEAPRYDEAKRALPRDDTLYPADCAGLDEAQSYACGAQRFWDAFRMNQNRISTYDLLKSILDRFKSSYAAPRARAELLFRRGQMANALATENKVDVARYLDEAQDDFSESMAEHFNPKVPPWLQSIQIPFALFAGERARAEAVFVQGMRDVELFPVGNILSLSGIALYMPMDTDMPKRMSALLDTWQCNGYEWCERNTYRAPYGMPGISYLFAEARARMGDLPRAVAGLEEAKGREGYETWPYKHVVEAALQNPQEFVRKFTQIEDSQPAWTQSYVTSAYGCLLCHGAPGHQPGHVQ